jgi:cobalt/nickel transport system permease protein
MNDQHRHWSPVFRPSCQVLGSSSLIGRVDPRARIVAAVGFSLVVALLANHFPALAVALIVAVLGVVLARLSPPAVLRRLAVFNLFVLLLLVVLPLSAEGPPLLALGPIAFSQEGFLLAAKIALKGNAIILALMVLLGTIEVTVLGHALSHLRVPDKLAHLLLFTVRYLDVLHREYLRLAAAIKVRGFRPRISRHTYRTYGYLVGMLLVRSFDRSERIVAAMKCRGFRGRFYLLDHFAFSWRDVPFCIVSGVVLAGLVWLEVWAVRG